jgi:formylglycine-generating enzyme required for sulfatase activity
MVGILPAGASPYGALDMEGNVEEWVADWFAPDYWKIAPSSNPQGPASGTARSSRGAGWDTESYLLVVSFTDFHKPEETSNVRGFRCAVTAP